MRGLGGICKVRLGIGYRGERGSGRAVYFVMLSDGVVLMLLAYAKNERDDVSPAQRKGILRLLKKLRK